ncbi:hypothetical protein Poli38472_005609 [Pythium oligandrum]|uniref:Integrator complex subunit 3 n=1 Tax=Pythium oligandrum TaxID=41045 RepID=A0A8K1CGB2_PYTOL|nr:hypothetical protein Poli38472_005609 [Pythium oligandrum]|eukprot:TMW62991.1 hypothetical protein Poli38472_005609 [Pythium oligandrum]
MDMGDGHDGAPPPPPASAADDHAPPPPPPPAGPPPPPAPVTVTAPASSVPAHVKASPASGSSASNSAPSSPGHALQTPHSKLVSHQPLDAPDELDRKWYAHFYHMQKTIQGKDDAATLAILKQPPPTPGGNSTSQLTFQPDIALLYAIITEPPLAKQYLRHLTAIANVDSYKSVIPWLQKLVDQKFVKLLGTCRSQLLWLVRELVHISAPGIDKVIISLMRHLTAGDSSRTSVWLASSIVRILIEHEAWLLSCTSFIPYVFHTFARIVGDHHGHSAHASLLQQETELLTTLWNRRQSDVAQLGREAVRVLNDAKEIPGINALWKQLRAVRDDNDQDGAVFSVSRLMATPTPPKYLAYRLTPKMEEYLVFMMERVQLGYVTRYQKWFATQFLGAPGSDALVPDLVRYICAVYHPSNQILGSKITPRYHILGWLYLLCKSPTTLARVQLAMFFDYLYFKQSDNIMNVEPAMLLMVKSLKSHPQMTLAMIQFLVFAVEKFASSATNKQLMQKGVSTAFAMILKLGVVPSIHVLQSFPLLLSNAPELKGELHRIFPEHFPSPDSVQAQAPSPPTMSPASPLHSPGGFSSPLRNSPARESPLRESPVHPGSPAASPSHPQSPSHSESSAGSAATTSDALSTSSFLQDIHRSPDIAESGEDATVGVGAAVDSLAKSTDVPPSLLVLGHEEFRSLQETMPEPCSRPTERFLESLNDILISWIRQDNAIELASPLGSFLYSSLERIILSSKISMSEAPKATCAGVFDSMLDQVLSESPDLFLPFLQAMYARDVSIGFRILVFCCSHSENKGVETALSAYLAFVDAIGSNLPEQVMKDLTLCQHIDDARAHAIALLEKTSSDTSGPKDEMAAVDAAVLHILPYLFRHLDHPSLSKLLGRNEALIQLLLSSATPLTFQTICSRVVLQEFSILKNRLGSVLLASLSWSSWEQFVLWDLVIAEVQASHSPAAVKSLMTAARRVLACANPDQHVETLNGLLKCLLHFSPDASMLQTVFKLRDTFDEFALAVLSSWIDKFPEVVKNYMLVILQTGNESTKDVDEILHKLEHLQRKRGSHTLSLLTDDVILSALRQIVQAQTYPTLAGFLVAPPAPATPPQDMSSPPPPPSSLSSPSTALGEEPPTKKQRLLGDN